LYRRKLKNNDRKYIFFTGIKANRPPNIKKDRFIKVGKGIAFLLGKKVSYFEN